MTEKRPLRLPSVKLVAIAAVAGIVAGAAAVYVKEAGYGKAMAESGECAAAEGLAKAVAPLAKGEVAALVAADQPRRIAGLSFVDGSGQAKTLDDLSGKTRLVNLWATWCVPCREEMPALNALQKAKGGESFEVVAINIDTGNADKPTNFMRDQQIDRLALYRDPSMATFNALKKEGLAFGLPVTLLVDDKGCLIGSMNGPAAWDSADAAALIDAAVTP